MRFMGVILSRLFFCIIRKYGVSKGIFDVHYMRLNWIHHVTGFIWTQSKTPVLHFERKTE